jgi:hypothetical protein
VGKRRIERLLAAIAAQPVSAGSVADRLCAATAAGLETTGVSIALAGSGQVLETVSATGDGRRGDLLQSDLGEGPAHDAHRNGWPVLVDDLEQDNTWPVFAPAALAIGMRSTFAFPLRRGSVRVGALTLYRPSAGGLSDEHYADAIVLARLALDLVLALQSESGPDVLDARFVDSTANTAGIHQATGVVSVQLGITVAAALSVLRAHAFTEDRSLRDVAGDVVAGRLRLTDDH